MDKFASKTGNKGIVVTTVAASEYKTGAVPDALFTGKFPRICLLCCRSYIHDFDATGQYKIPLCPDCTAIIENKIANKDKN